MYGRRRVVNRRRRVAKKRMAPRKKFVIRRAPRYTTNTASVKEAYQVVAVDGAVTFFRNIQLADIIYDRSQAVAQAYQQYRIKYVKMTFRPSADTFAPVPGNIIPQLYWMIDKTNSIPLNATADTFFSMGARPKRMDDKNKVFAFKPSALVADYSAAGVTTASQLKISPWLSTNANSGNPAAAWAPSSVDHLGCAFYVTKINPADTIQYAIDIEVVFEFRKPLWKGTDSAEQNNKVLINGEVVPVTIPPPA